MKLLLAKFAHLPSCHGPSHLKSLTLTIKVRVQPCPVTCCRLLPFDSINLESHILFRVQGIPISSKTKVSLGMIASGVLLLEGTVVGKEAVDWLEKARSLSLCQIRGGCPKQRTTIATIVKGGYVLYYRVYVCTLGM